jgi:hypothetical protein
MEIPSECVAKIVLGHSLLDYQTRGTGVPEEVLVHSAHSGGITGHQCLDYGLQSPPSLLLPPASGLVGLWNQLLLPGSLNVRSAYPFQQRSVNVLVIDASGESLLNALQIITSVAREVTLGAIRESPGAPAPRDQGLGNVSRMKRVPKMFQFKSHWAVVGPQVTIGKCVAGFAVGLAASLRSNPVHGTLSAFLTYRAGDREFVKKLSKNCQ